MRSRLRATAAAGISVTLLISGAVAAYADDTAVMPSQAQIARAQADAASKARDVEAIRSELAAAQRRLVAAQEAASVASENYNGAMWRLSESRKASAAAEAEAERMAARVVAQRSGIARLVVQSYQEGTQINSMTAMLDAEGPTSLMGRQAVVDMAGDSLEADMRRFEKLSTVAQQAQDKAAEAARQQEELAQQAKAARDAAVGAVSSAGAAQSEITRKRDELVSALAKAQNISLGLAQRRQSALEQLAAEKAAKAARTKAAREAAAAAARDAREARRAQLAQKDAQKDAQKQAQQDTTPPPPVDNAPPAPAGGVSAAIAFARAQIGEPYQWGAAGPNSWDCSGLTMMAWRAGGRSLPHYSRAQFDMGTRIPLSQVQPGDLYFWSNNGSPSGIHHVALAIGGGRFIEAPRTGLDVRENSINTWFPTFAVRL